MYNTYIMRIIQLDEETDADLLAALIERRAPFGLSIVNTAVSGHLVMCIHKYIHEYACMHGLCMN
jgi:hypothetical protein